MKAGEEISTGNVRSAKEAFRDVGISAASGFITGAFGAKFPGAHRLAEGVVDTVVSAGERFLYAVFDDSMSWEEKRAYAFDPGQMVADFVTGVVIGEILDGIMAATQNKLGSIFANYDAAMCEALESGSKSIGTDELVVRDTKFLDADGNIDWEKWAPNGGRVPGTIKENQTILAGTIIDRYGSQWGKYTSPAGVPYEQRALPYIENPNAYHKYEVLKPIDNVTISEIAPAFEQVGGGIQYELPNNIKKLKENDIIELERYNKQIFEDFNNFGIEIEADAKIKSTFLSALA